MGGGPHGEGLQGGWPVGAPFVKDPEKSITQYTAEVAKAIGATICPVKFERFERGEGIEKRHDNLADEIAQMQNM